MIDTNYIEMSHKWELLESRLLSIENTANMLRETLKWIHDQDRDIKEYELKEFEDMIPNMENDLKKVKHLINVRWTRF